MKKGSFIFYDSFEDAISECEDSVKLEAYMAIVRYGLFREEPDTSKMGTVARIIWKQAKPQLDANWKKYEDGCKGAEHGVKGKEYGVKGGNPNLKKGKPNPYYQNEGEDNPPHNPPHNPPNDNDNDNDNDNEFINRKSERIFGENPLAPEKVRAIQENIDKGKWRKACELIMNAWNTAIEGGSCKPVRVVNEKRWKAVRSLCQYSSFTAPKFISAIQQVKESPYLQGGGEDGFVASFDWVFGSSVHAMKVANGDYRSWE